VKRGAEGVHLFRLFCNLTKEEYQKYPQFGAFLKIHTMYPGDFPVVRLELPPPE
jgi:hypothetical protein